jgi:hypothetical protein
MEGELRWATKMGGSSAIWRPETIMTLDEGTGAGEAVFYVNLIPDSMVEGVILEITATQKAQVDDWDLQEFTITTLQEAESPIQAGQTIRVWGFPVEVEGGVSAGATSIRVSTSLSLASGDRLQVPIEDGEFEFTNPHDIEEVSFVEEDAEGKKFILTLAEGVHRDVASDEVLYIRAWPAYFSGRIPLPDYSANYLKVVGPFLLDWMSGPLMAADTAEEYISLRQYRADRSLLTPTRTGTHNIAVNRMPIRADQMLFWKLVAGEINHDGTWTHATCDEHGHFRLTEKLNPLLEYPDYFATGSIAAVATASLSNNESFTIGDGATTRTFEFKVDGAYVAAPGRITIDISSVTLDSEVASKIAAAIASSGLGIDNAIAGRVVNLSNRTPGSAGNVTITENVTAALFTVAGMIGGEIDLSWIITIESEGDATLMIQFQPNALDTDHTYTLTSGSNAVEVKFPSTYEPATHIDVKIKDATPGTVVKFSDWTLNGSRTSYVETETVVRVETDQWAGSFLFVKPLWPNFDLLKPIPGVDKMNGGGLLL